MSTGATIFAVYLGIGFFWMIVAMASSGKEKRAQGFDGLESTGEFGVGVMLFVALLWPIWLVAMFAKKDPKD